MTIDEVIKGMKNFGAWDEELEAIEKLKEENKRLRDLKRTCECGEDDQCMFARERDEARREVERLRTIVDKLPKKKDCTTCRSLVGCDRASGGGPDSMYCYEPEAAEEWRK